jgi:transcription elongation GreA/GreB family factor
LNDRIKTAEEAMLEAQEAAKGEEKSSAGDKYETSRAMAHLNSEMNARQLQEAKRELAELILLNTAAMYNQVTGGAVVVCKEQTYFIALGLGPSVINGQKITFLSPQAPIAVLLYHKKPGDSVVFNSKPVEIVEVF